MDDNDTLLDVLEPALPREPPAALPLRTPPLPLETAPPTTRFCDRLRFKSANVPDDDEKLDWPGCDWTTPGGLIVTDTWILIGSELVLLDQRFDVADDAVAAGRILAVMLGLCCSPTPILPVGVEIPPAAFLSALAGRTGGACW